MIPLDDIKALVARNPGQMTAKEYARVYEEIERVAPGKVMVFGAGRDSFLWLRANADGETVFVDDSLRWLEEPTRAALKSLGRGFMRSFLVKYRTKVENWREDLDAGERLLMSELADASRQSFDLVLVDGPRGEGPRAPGRAQSIYMASVLAKKGGKVLVHDVHRPAEKGLCAKYLGPKCIEVDWHLGVWTM